MPSCVIGPASSLVVTQATVCVFLGAKALKLSLAVSQTPAQTNPVEPRLLSRAITYLVPNSAMQALRIASI
jgi:hypothetical protein